MRRVVLVLATMALAIIVAGGVAQAIINGEPDRGPKAHPYVGAYVAKLEGKRRPVCSGTLISQPASVLNCMSAVLRLGSYLPSAASVRARATVCISSPTSAWRRSLSSMRVLI